MTFEAHLRLVRKGILLAGWALLAAVLMQAVLGRDFDGLPFLVFGIVVGALGLSLLARLLWARLPHHRI
jgi:hypothetical protein